MKPNSLTEKLIWVGCWTGFSAGAVFLLLAFGFGIHSAYFLHHSVSATGTVTKMVERQSPNQNGDGSVFINYYPEFSYVAASGKSYVVDSNFGSNPSSFAIGQQVPVRYEISDPSGAEINSFGEQWGFLLAFGLGASLLILLAYWCRLRARKRGIILNDFPF